MVTYDGTSFREKKDNGQGVSLVHFSAQRKHFLWARGCIQGLFRGYIAGVSGY